MVEVRYATWRKRTAGAVVPRKIMAKFNAVDSDLPAEHWGKFYRGCSNDASGPLSHAENVCRGFIESAAMARAKARGIVENLDTS